MGFHTALAKSGHSFTDILFSPKTEIKSFKKTVTANLSIKRQVHMLIDELDFPVAYLLHLVGLIKDSTSD